MRLYSIQLSMVRRKANRGAKEHGVTNNISDKMEVLANSLVPRPSYFVVQSTRFSSMTDIQRALREGHEYRID